MTPPGMTPPGMTPPGMTPPLAAAVVDAFTSRPFGGNPAAVVLLDQPAAGPVERDDGWRHAVATEFGLPMTAFLTPREDATWGLRWFNATSEVRLCGHATLASAHWLWETGRVQAPRVTFRTLSGDLGATRDGAGRVVLDLPLRPVLAVQPPPALDEALGGATVEWFGMTAGSDPLDRMAFAVIDLEHLLKLIPDLQAVIALGVGGLLVSARPESVDERFTGVDVVSRFFAPAIGVPEDPVTGSAHCSVADYWATELGREVLRCRQASARGGELVVTRTGSRALVAGHAVTMWDVSIRQ